MAAGFGERGLGKYVLVFSIRLGAGYRCIRKRPKGKPSPQPYAYKTEKGLRINILGMIDRNYRYEGFSATGNMTADKVADFLDRLWLRVCKNTFAVIDNASVHRCKLMRELRPIWEKRDLFLFFLPPYSPYLNIAETLWRIFKGKWLRPVDYCSTDSLIYATDRALAALGTELNINFAHAA